MVCNTDGVSTFFDGNYPYLIEPLERSMHGAFNFGDYMIDQPLGSVVLTVLSWRDADGYAWTIPEEERVQSTWTRVRPYFPEGVG